MPEFKGNPQCQVCLGTNFIKSYSPVLKKCATCGHITANMAITPEILAKAYSEEYFTGAEYDDYIADKEKLQSNFRDRLKFIFRKITKPELVTSVLEIGAAYGFFGEALLKAVPQAKYVGIDVAKEAIAYGQKELKLNLIAGDYQDVPFTQKFSDVFMWDVLEHLQFPRSYLEKIHSETEPGSRVYITTGDISAFLPKRQKAKWRMIHPPTHIHYFTKDSVKRLLEETGFSVKSITYPGVSRSVRQIFYSLFLLKKEKPSKLMTFLYKLIPNKLAISLNTFDIMLVIAERK